MTITSEFTGTENYAERMAGLEAIHDWWFGTGSFAAAATLGQVRANLNTLLVGTTILNRETFATWLAKVNTLNEPDEYAAALTFGEGQSGALWQCTLPTSLRAATDGTGEAAVGATIARINDSSGNALHLTQASTSLRPVRGRRPKTGKRNHLTYTEDLANAAWTTVWTRTGGQTAPDGTATAWLIEYTTAGQLINQFTARSTAVTLTAWFRLVDIGSATTLGFIIRNATTLTNAGTGTLNLSTLAFTAGGAGTSAAIEAHDAGWYKLTVTVTQGLAAGDTIQAQLGSSGAATGLRYLLWHPQVEAGETATAYQKVVSTYDTTESGAESVSYAAFDLVDDAMATGVIAGGLTGQAFVAGDGGCYVSDLSIAPGGTFTIGYTAYNSYSWTGAAPGLLRAVTDNTGRVLDAMIRAGAYTEDEIIRLERYYRALGGKGLLVPSGPNLVPGGDFGSAAGWTLGAGWSISGGTATFATTGVGSNLTRTIATTAGAWYLMEADLLTASGYSPTLVSYAVLPDAVSPLLGTDPGHRTWAWRALASTTVVGLRGAPITDIASFDNLSVRRLIPREDL